MDKERIASLRRVLEDWKADKISNISLYAATEMLDAIEGAQAELATAREVIEESMEARRTSEAEGGALNQLNNEIDRLRAELAALRGQVGGVVPELTGAPILQEEFADNGGHSHWNLFGSGTGELIWTEAPEEEWAKHHRRPLSALHSPRSTRDGMVEVPAEEWAAMSAIGYDPEPCRHDHHGYCQEHGWFSKDPCPTGIMQRLRAANGKGEVTPATPDPAP